MGGQEMERENKKSKENTRDTKIQQWTEWVTAMYTLAGFVYGVSQRATVTPVGIPSFYHSNSCVVFTMVTEWRVRL